MDTGRLGGHGEHTSKNLKMIQQCLTQIASWKKKVKYLDVDNDYMAVDVEFKPGIEIMETS